jgi:branched-chain amino acid transport system ATP-binding protein
MLEHAAGAGVAVHRSGDADRYRSWLNQAGNGAAQGTAMTPLACDYALEVVSLNKAFDGLTVTQNVSLAIRPGERRLIIGPNGAGKTTLFNQISGDMRPNSGQIRLFGTDVTTFLPYKRAHLGLSRTYQIITLFTGDTLEHNVTLGLLGLLPSRWQMWRPLSFYGDLAREARRTLDTVGLLHLADHPVSEIAYGEKRRVELAMALAQKPRVLLLDEPLAGLSNTERSTVKSLIASIPRETAVIMIEHDMDTALDLAETVTLLNYGRVIVDGERDVVIADERTREVYLGV